MSQFSKSVAGVTDRQSINLDTFEDINVKSMEVQSADIASLNIQQDLICGGNLEAPNAKFNTIRAGDFVFDQNVMKLENSTFDQIIIEASDILLRSNNTALTDIASITTSQLEVKDGVITIGNEDTNASSDRGIHFRYLSGGVFKNGFFGYNQSDAKFRFLTDISISNNSIAKVNSKYGTLGEFELNNILANKVANNSSDDTLTLEATTDLNLKSGQDTEIISSNGNITIKCDQDSNSVTIGNGTSQKTTINSNLEVKGTLEAEDFSYFNSLTTTYNDKNLIFNIGDAVKISSIVRDGTDTTLFTINFNEDRSGYTAGDYIYIEGIGDSNFDTIHEVETVPDTLSITIKISSSPSAPTNITQATLGKLSSESNSSGGGITVVSYGDTLKELRSHHIIYDYNSNNHKDSSWSFNRNIKTENTLLLKPQSFY